jgi:hypothetical protein
MKPRYWLAAGPYKVNYNVAIARAQHARRKFDNPREGARIANRADAFGTVPTVPSEVLCSLEYAR